MKEAIAIAKVKVREKISSSLYSHQKMTNFGHHASKAGLSMLLLTTAFIGFIAFTSLAVGVVHSGGISTFLTGWFNSISIF